MNITNNTAVLYILCMDIPNDPNVFAWKTRTINVFGNTEDADRFSSTLDRKLKGKSVNVSFILILLVNIWLSRLLRASYFNFFNTI